MKYVYQVQVYYSGWLNGGPIFTSTKKAEKSIPKTYKESYRIVRYELNTYNGRVVWIGDK
jgi:hypothetical protein